MNSHEVATLAAMRVLGVDMGSKRIGLAISDETGTIAFPAGAIASRGRKKDVEALQQLIEEKQIGSAVLGLPIHMDGRRGPEAEKVLAFAAALAKAAGIPVQTLDERWTSREAERLLQGSSKKRRKKERDAGRVDELAASIILRTYLESRANEISIDPENGSPEAGEREPCA
jgi:putative Holliday junction resolvase